MSDPSTGEVPVGAAGRTIRGRVHRADGGGVERAVLTLIDPTGRQVGRAHTRSDGGFAVEAPEPGTYVLIASAGLQQPQALSVTVGDHPVEVDVELSGTASLTGTVRTDGGRGVAGATVTLTDARGEVVRAVATDESGGYAVADLPGGVYTLVAAGGSFRPAAATVAVPDIGAATCEVVLSSATELRVRVHSAVSTGSGSAGAGSTGVDSGTAVPGARITVLDGAGDVVGVADADEAGEHRFAGLTAGPHTVIASGDRPVTTVLRVVGGSYVNHDVRLGVEEGQ
ncbi:hypothetical protein G4X40_16205 [Rhodococcus sp. D2-41]|uniref:MSCRAMM family protein n=1 Tax=Speluncibacter jeojiensis TaxID=2710754 RepID=UPI00240FE061|nr:carboxypeptidase regulatory-like domain-containing protein [Rhodococcus sp. D2-41]MDG3011688.1 hypothetical protein [Rhodococcus sp. D2-41]